MREICTSGSVGGEDGNILTYPAREAPDVAALHPGYFLRLRGALSSLSGGTRASRRSTVAIFGRGPRLWSPALPPDP